MRGQALTAGVMAVAAALSPLPAMAQPHDTYAYDSGACQKQRQNRMVAGGLLGALAGAMFGSNVAARGARSEGGVLGAVAGAVAGGAIARSTVKCDGYDGRYNDRPYASRDDGRRYADRRGWDDDGYGLDGGGRNRDEGRVRNDERYRGEGY